MTLITKISAIVIVLLFVTVSYANEHSDYLSLFLNRVQTMESDFRQTLFDAQGTELESVTGAFFLSRPDKFRWDYRKPYQQTIVTDGQSLWFYDKDLEQVSIRDMSAIIKDMPITILSDYEDVQRYFVIRNIGQTHELAWIELISKDEKSQYQSIRLGFEKERLAVMVMIDSFDQLTRIDFTKEVINKKLDNSIFSFHPPQGVDIIDIRAASGY